MLLKTFKVRLGNVRFCIDVNSIADVLKPNDARYRCPRNAQSSGWIQTVRP